jgi:DUF438 domain-containing protein
MNRMLVESGTLAEHHRRCDALFAAAREAAASAAPQLAARVNDLRAAILDHFSYEEKHIFPLFEQSDGREGSCEWLRAQHDDIRAALWLLGTLSAEAEPQRYRSELAALQAAFDAHAAEEEQRMYPLFSAAVRGTAS